MFSKNNRNNNDINNFNEVSCIELGNDYEGESDNVNNKNINRHDRRSSSKGRGLTLIHYGSHNGNRFGSINNCGSHNDSINVNINDNNHVSNNQNISTSSITNGVLENNNKINNSRSNNGVRFSLSSIENINLDLICNSFNTMTNTNIGTNGVIKADVEKNNNINTYNNNNNSRGVYLNRRR